MKKHYIIIFVFALSAFSQAKKIVAQCPAGFIQANINWDNLDFLVLSGTYTPYVSTALVQNQNFALGKNRMTFIHDYNSSNSLSENTLHTGEAGTFGAGADVQFMGNGAITLNFASPVQNLKFSLYDIDYGQRAAFSAFNGATAINVNLATLTGSVLTITNNNTTTARVDAAATTAVDLNSTNAAVNVTVAGPVTSITITISNTGTKTSGQPSSQEDGSFWVSDIAACVTGTFPNNYYAVSKPFTGQPGYILTVVDNKVYYTNPANGVSRFLFTDPGNNNINSLAYDPYNRIIYYTYSLVGTPQNERAIRKYNVNTKTISIVTNDVYSSLGIPTYENGVTSGAAAFYDGAYYIGIEGYNTGTTTGRKSLVWRIDFDGSLNPIQATQVYGSNADNGSTTIHDWSDIGIYDGILYDFDGAASDPDIFHFNLQTGDTVRFAPGSTPRQVAVDWQGEVYNVTNTVQKYNKDGTMGTAYTISSTPAIPGGGSWGDGAEAFRPLMDFGDAPISYEGADPVWAPAVHDLDTAIRLGANIDIEWLKRGSSAPATDDNFDDGITFTPIYAKITGGYSVQVRVWNNSGSNATLCAWLDYNGNGVFDTGEGITPITVNSMASMQTKNLIWTGITTTLANGSFTYLRIRITSASNGMTAANPTGFFNNGEIEDYRVLVDDFPLKVSLNTFNAILITKSNVKIDWSTLDEDDLFGFELQRSKDNLNWKILDTILAKGNKLAGINYYNYNDLSPLSGKSFYRLKLINGDGKTLFSETRIISNDNSLVHLKVFPLPATNKINMEFYASKNAEMDINIFNQAGVLCYSLNYFARKGNNFIEIPLSKISNSGLYILNIQTENAESINQKIIINK